MNAELDTTFVKVCDLEDLAVGTPALADVDGIPMALVRTAPDEVHAVNDVCTHANVSLSEGELDGCTLECWLHGSRFDLRTGTPSGPPATVPVAVYPVALVEAIAAAGAAGAREAQERVQDLTGHPSPSVRACLLYTSPSPRDS